MDAAFLTLALLLLVGLVFFIASKTFLSHEDIFVYTDIWIDNNLPFVLFLVILVLRFIYEFRGRL